MWPWSAYTSDGVKPMLTASTVNPARGTAMPTAPAGQEWQVLTGKTNFFPLSVHQSTAPGAIYRS